MSNQFKVGDKAKALRNFHLLIKGKEYDVLKVEGELVSVSVEGAYWTYNQKRFDPALPNNIHTDKSTSPTSVLMPKELTAKDMIAIEAMKGILSKYGLIESHKKIATTSYDLAEALLAERNNRQS